MYQDADCRLRDPVCALQDDMWQAMLMHELGHCIDVHIYGRWATTPVGYFL